MGLGIAGILLAIALVLLFSGLFTVQQQTHAIIERFGKFHKICGPGLNFKLPLIDSIAGRVTHRVRELEIKVESKSKDDVFVDLLIAVQYYVEETDEAVTLAHYKLTNPAQQMSSYVFDTVRALVPEMLIDNVFGEKERIAAAVKDRLEHTMRQFGYTILQSLVNDIQPDSKVKEAMNQVNASARLREAARNDAEAQKIRVIASAEAEARAKELQGVGIARQRLAIANGLKESVAACAEAGISPEEATRMVLLTQHYDTVTAVGGNARATVIMMPYGPGGMSSVSDQIMQALVASQQLDDGPPPTPGAAPTHIPAPRPPRNPRNLG
jgi:regulator of protease activity HflC (stomatin/prohibitin superfamily)